MMQSKQIKAWALASTLLSGFAMTAPVYAQDADDAEEAYNDTIVVTGSRISRSSFDTTQPSEIIDAEEIELRGYTNAIDAVLDIPGVFANTDIGDQGTNGVGQQLPNLYGLGTNRTLSLIDGKRFVSSNSPVGGSGAPGSQVDLNNIPVALIERVDVVKVGGAPVYGSDAVAGVVNYILKDDYEGFEVAVDYGQWMDVEDDPWELSIRSVIGGNFDNGRGNAVVALDWSETSPVLESQIQDLAENWSRFTPAGDLGVVDPETGVVPGYQVRVVPNATAGIVSFGGLITPISFAITNIGLGAFPDGNFYQFSPDGSGSVVNYDAGTPTGNIVWASGGDGLTLDGVTPFRSPVNRTNFSSFITYQLTDNINFSLDVFANQFDGTETIAQPRYSSGLFGGTAGALYFDADYAYVTPELSSLLATNSLDGFYLQKGFLEVNPSASVNETTVFSYNATLDGTFNLADRDVVWNLTYQSGSSSIYTARPDISEDRFFAALDVGINPETGQIDCRFNYDSTFEAPLAGNGAGVIDDIGALGSAGDCSPYDPFGTPSQEAIDYVSVMTTGYTDIEQEVLSGFVSLDSVIGLPAGDLGFATGFESRREFASYQPGAGNQLDVTYFGGSSPTSGEYHTFDIYAETLVPLIGGDFTPIPFLETADLEASYRLINNTRAGLDEAWAVGLSLGFVENVNFRANAARTVRAPAVTELFLPRVSTGSFAADPCSVNNITNGPNPDVRAANCAADGVPTDFVSQAQNASVQGFTGGNPALRNEIADSYNVGIIWSPRWVEGLTLSADYVNIAIEDAIVTFTLTQIMEACYDSSSFPNVFCTYFTRQDDSQLPSLNAFTSGYVNAASRLFDSVELAARYVRDVNDLPLIGESLEGDWGSLDVNLRLYNVQTNTTSATGSDYSDTVGQSSNPDWRGDIRAQWYKGPLSLFTDVEYYGHGIIDKFANPYQYIGNDGQELTDLDGYFTVDFGGSYDWNNMTFRASVNNVFDWSPSADEKAFGRYSLGRTVQLGLTSRF